MRLNDAVMKEAPMSETKDDGAPLPWRVGAIRVSFETDILDAADRYVGTGSDHVMAERIVRAVNGERDAQERERALREALQQALTQLTLIQTVNSARAIRKKEVDSSDSIRAARAALAASGE